jgi:hypothetical protein
MLHMGSAKVLTICNGLRHQTYDDVASFSFWVEYTHTKFSQCSGKITGWTEEKLGGLWGPPSLLSNEYRRGIYYTY